MLRHALSLVHRGLLSTLAVLFAVSVLGLAQAQSAQPPRVGEPQAAHLVYLPLLARDGTAAPTPPPPPAPTVQGWFTKPEKKTGSGAIAIDSAGGSHFAYRDHVPFAEKPSVYYAYCSPPASQCRDASTWSHLNLGGPVNDVQLKLTPTGQPRMLVTISPTAAGLEKHYVYMECNTGCLDENNWNYVDVTYSYTNTASDVTSYYQLKRFFALDSAGRPRFVFYDGNFLAEPDRYGGYYAACDSDCLASANWSVTRFTRAQASGSQRYETLSNPALVFAADGSPRVVAGLGPLDDPAWYNDPPLYYFACNADCGDEASWQRTKISGDAGGAYPSWDLALDSADRPRVAFFSYQGSDEGAEKLFYLQCDANCTSGGSWQKLDLGLPSGAGTGANVELDRVGRPRIAYLRNHDLGYSWCDANCANAASWQHRVVETSADLDAQYPIARPFTCDAALWDTYAPHLLLDAAGQPSVAYEGSYKARCYDPDPTDPSKPPVYEFREIWHSVRVTFFSQP